MSDNNGIGIALKAIAKASADFNNLPIFNTPVKNPEVVIEVLVPMEKAIQHFMNHYGGKLNADQRLKVVEVFQDSESRARMYLMLDSETKDRFVEKAINNQLN